ncbi:hypothetical protein OO013_10950 [Mangrovivirga sp. M17]|uniref:Fibronectin type-III domain-containing protein n=1 Tax=Mangrovivirga halotolerans TaxID=2993936 RepID=A0ABT3RSQ5_9BACT|nr:hypothetical protein [Mangrovivirga halotolerans]MCX2744388.1 hypothetical protein [Mangrovivirga halotolerans]
MKSYRSILIILLVLLSFDITKGQTTGLKAISRADENGVSIKWAADNYGLWRDIIDNGVIIERISQSTKEKKTFRINTADGKEFLKEGSDYTLVAAEMIFGEGEVDLGGQFGPFEYYKAAKDQEYRFGISQLVNDYSFKTAQLSGFAFRDSPVKKDTYIYRVALQNQPENFLAATVANFNGQSPEKVFFPRIFYQLNDDNSVALRWKDNSYDFVGYNIYKSIGENGFEKINEAPYINVDQAVFLDYYDSLSTTDGKVKYKVAGLTPYGDSIVSDPVVMNANVKVSGKTEINQLVDHQIDDQGRLTFYTANQLGKNTVLMHSKSESGTYAPINNSAKDQNSIWTDDPVSGYYILENNGKKSFPYLVQLLDSIAPAVPRIDFIELRDTINNVVAISFNRPSDSDFKGYRLFRRGVKGHEPIYLSATESDIYYDTLSTQAAYDYKYSVAAYDNRYNLSERSEEVVYSNKKNLWDYLSVDYDEEKPELTAFSPFEVEFTLIYGGKQVESKVFNKDFKFIVPEKYRSNFEVKLEQGDELVFQKAFIASESDREAIFDLNPRLEENKLTFEVTYPSKVRICNIYVKDGEQYRSFKRNYKVDILNEIRIGDEIKSALIEIITTDNQKINKEVSR